MKRQTFVDKNNLAVKHYEVNDDRKNFLIRKKRENFLINELTKQIVDLNKWRERAILEAVEKDR